jgi:tetratricopeptide (TPR) repeat protein
LKFDEGDVEEARALFDRAVQTDDRLYLALYYKTMLSAEKESNIRAGLARVIEINPGFAPAYIQLAGEELRAGNLEAALGWALKAQQLWPSKAGYHILIGRILGALGRDAEAAGVARYVAARWPDIEPAATPRARVVRGRITSVACRDKDQVMRIVLDGMPLTFRVKDDTILNVGDTVWYGADHFNRCHHLRGMDALIEYSPASRSGLNGEITRLDIQQNFGFR